MGGGLRAVGVGRVVYALLVGKTAGLIRLSWRRSAIAWCGGSSCKVGVVVIAHGACGIAAIDIVVVLVVERHGVEGWAGSVAAWPGLAAHHSGGGRVGRVWGCCGAACSVGIGILLGWVGIGIVAAVWVLLAGLWVLAIGRLAVLTHGECGKGDRR